MAKKGERLGSQEDGRVLSEHLTVSLKRGQKEKLKEAAKKRGKPGSTLVQEALDNWIFTPRNGGEGKAGKPRRASR